MLYGAIIGAVIGLIIGIIRALTAKGEVCPECGESLPTPWAKPLEECPSCGAWLRGRRGRPERGREPSVRRRGRSRRVPSAAPMIISIVAAVVGLASAGILFPSMMEHRRVRDHRERQLEQMLAEQRSLQGRADPVSRQRSSEFQIKIRNQQASVKSWDEEYTWRLIVIITGGVIFLGGSVAAILCWRARSRWLAENEDFLD